MKNSNMRNAFLRISKNNVVKTDNAALGIKKGDVVSYSKEQILEILDLWAQSKTGLKYYFIEHDADEKNKHYHLVLEFGNQSQCRFSTLKNKFPYGDIEKCRHGVKTCVQYLVHMNDPQKHQYSWNEVVTNSPLKLESYKIPGHYAENVMLKTVVDKIIDGQIREYEIPEKIDHDLYVKYANRIKNAFDYRQKMIQLDSGRSINVVVLQGKPRVGKTTFAREYAKKNGKSFCLSSSSNDPLQDYSGEDCFALDDFNHEAFAIEDFMKLIDPHSNTSIKSRYKNKKFIGDTMFVITNVSITEWYSKQRGIHRSALFNRITAVFEFGDLSREGVVDYTINSIREFDEEIDRNGKKEKIHRTVLVPEGKGRFELWKYVDISSDAEKKQKIIEELKEL